MSFPFNGTVSRVSNGTIEVSPENQFDGQKVTVGSKITVGAVEVAEPDVPAVKKTARKSVGKTASAAPVAKKATPKKSARKG